MIPRSFSRVSFVLAFSFFMAACGSRHDPEAPLVPMGDFRLGHVVVIDDQAEIGPFSRKAEAGAWKEVLTEEIGKQLGRYKGGKLYHLGIRVDGYVLAIPGVPVVVNPKSVLIVSVTVWDDAKEGKLTARPQQLVVLERLSPETFIGSGLTQNRQRQMRNLSRNMAAKIHGYLLKNPEWFGLQSGAAPLPGGGGDK